VYIPVEARAVTEGAVGLREEAAGQGGRDDSVDRLVEDDSEEHLVDVQGQRGQRHLVGQWPHRLGEPLRRWDRKRITHIQRYKMSM
jgi:hypothetical protein